MGLGVKFTVDKTAFKKSVRTLRRQLPEELKKGLRVAGDQIALNIKGRLHSGYSSLTSKKSQAMLKHIRASTPVATGNNLFIGIGNIENLDTATEVMAKSTGKTYHLWSLMEFGYGMRGGTRSGLYDIYPIQPTSAQGQSYYKRYGGTRRGGVHHSDPKKRTASTLVFYMDGRLVFASHVKHPGAEGRHFFLTASQNWYKEDMLIARDFVTKDIDQFLQTINYRTSNA